MSIFNRISGDKKNIDYINIFPVKKKYNKTVFNTKTIVSIWYQIHYNSN